MRTLLLMRGAPGCGKSTFVKQHDLENYTLEPDKIRMMYSSPQMQVDGSHAISQDIDDKVWTTLFEILESRLERGEFTVIDATNLKTKDMTRYKDLCDKYRYRMYCVDFTDVPLETCLRQNKMREPLKYVPEEVIRNIYARFANQKIPGGIKVIKPNEFDTILEKPFDLSNYEKIVHIGDVHGTFDTLMQYFNEYPINDKTEYIFCGDYLDRGNQNAEVFKFLDGIKDLPNVCLLQGNHECFSEDTEFLTENGWKKFNEIKEEKLAQVDLETNLISYDFPIERIRKNSSDVLKVDENFLNFKVTRHHMVIYDNKKIEFETLNLENLDITKFKYSCENNFEDLPYSNSILKMIAWIIADGTIWSETFVNPNNKKCRVQFHLSREDKKENLEAILKECNINYTKRKATLSGGNVLQPYMYRFYGDNARYFFNLLGRTKKLPQEFMFINAKQFKVILEELIKTDGHLTHNRVVYTSTDLYNLNILQIAAISNGYTTKITEKINSGFSKNKIYVLTIYLKETQHKGFNKIAKVTKCESQKVVCFQMPKGTLVTRLNGKVSISGNCHIQKFGNEERAASKEFEHRTKPQLENAGITSKDARMFFRKIRQCSYYKYNDIEVLVCHGGIPSMDKNLLYIPANAFIKGVGEYEDYKTIAENWMDNTKPNQYLIHGHRNTSGDEPQICDRVFNLEGGVEFGGQLRIVELTKDGFKCLNYDNIQPVKLDEVVSKKDVSTMTVDEAIGLLQGNRFVQEKQLGKNISSFNFTRLAFEKKNWDAQTILARGFFVNTQTKEITARSYEKFFRIDENFQTRLSNLRTKLVFPVTAYVKENGYLGIVSYDKANDELFIASKSTNKGDFADKIKDIIDKKYDKIKLIDYLKDKNETLVFEVISPEFDPHIIEYDEEKLVLLDSIFNTLEFNKRSYAELGYISGLIGIERKKIAYSFATWNDFYTFYNKIYNNYDYQYEDKYIEGFVFEDSEGFMFKFKTEYYNEWKKLRSLMEPVLRLGYTTKTGQLFTEMENNFYGYCRDLYNNYYNKETKSYPFKTDIISLRKGFLWNKN